MKITIIGGGLAGSEIAYYLANKGVQVSLFEARPKTMTKAHKTDKLAELVCSNSLRGNQLSNAAGLLKEELKILGSLVMESALENEVPAGSALAVDREGFSEYITDKISNHPNIEVIREEITKIPQLDHPVAITTGPLTMPGLARQIALLTGEESFSFYDAISPIVTHDSIDFDFAFFQSRYDKGDGKDYLNIPLTEDEYYAFIKNVDEAQKYSGKSEVENEEISGLKPFEGCMPIEDMIERGAETLRFGPLKPKGLTNPKTGKSPYAVIQLRKDNSEGTLYNMVGFQTRLKQGEQQRIIRSIPALKNAEFVRLGSVHRNSFINSPKSLDKYNRLKANPKIFMGGQITGVEGYVESTASGLVSAVNIWRTLKDLPLIEFPRQTATGSLINYITDESIKDFQPMNISYGLMPTYFEKSKEYKSALKAKKIKFKKSELKATVREMVASDALEVMKHFVNEFQITTE